MQGLTIGSADGHSTIYKDNDLHVFLTADIAPALEILDRQHAMGAMMLGALVGHTSLGAIKNAWKPLAQKTIDERNLRYKKSAFVVIEIEGEIAATLPSNLKVEDGHGVCLDAYNKNTVAELNHVHVANALSAIRLIAPTACQFELVTQGSFLISARWRHQAGGSKWGHQGTYRGNNSFARFHENAALRLGPQSKNTKR